MSVIPFTIPAAQPRRADTRDSEARGAILFFTGVRIERHDRTPDLEPRPTKAPKARGQPVPRPSRKA